MAGAGPPRGAVRAGRRGAAVNGIITWSVVLGTLTAAVVVAALLTWPVSLLALGLYRWTLARGMRRFSAGSTATTAPGDERPQGPRAASSVVRLDELEPRTSTPLAQAAGRAVFGARLAYCGAALAYALSSALVFLWVGGLDFHPVRFVVLALLSAWLTVPTLLAVGLTSRRTTIALWASYAALLLALPVVGGVSPGQSLTLLTVQSALPALFIAGTSARRLRGVAWLVAPGLAALTLAVSSAYPVWLYLHLGVPFDADALGFLAATVATVAALCAYVYSIVWRYAHKRASDQSLMLAQWWFVLTVDQALSAATAGPWHGVAWLLPFAAYVTVADVLLSRVRRSTAGKPPATLLLLRTFGHRGRSERLLRDLTGTWRWIGTIQLIGGTDLASETLEPDEFLDFVRGRTWRRFVRSSAEVDQRIRELDLAADRDGRYRVNELLRHDDSWQETFQRLAPTVDAILLDVRGYTAANAGVRFELEQLVQRVPLRRAVALTDGTTDLAVLRETLQDAVSRRPAAPPVTQPKQPTQPTQPKQPTQSTRATQSTPPRQRTPELQATLNVLPMRGNRTQDARRLLDALSQVADTAAPAHQVGTGSSTPPAASAVRRED